MPDSIINTIKQRNEIIRYIEFLCSRIVSDSEEKDNFKRFTASFYLKNLDSNFKVHSEKVEEGLGSLSKLKLLFVLSFFDQEKTKERNEYLKELINDYKNKEKRYLEEIIKIVLINCDLFDDKKLVSGFKKLLSDSKIQPSTLIEDYLSVLSDEKTKLDISIEKWDSTSFEIYTEIIKMRLLFLAGLKIKEKRALYLKEHYCIVSELCRKVNIFSLPETIVGDDLYSYVLLALMLRKIGYDEGLFLPDIERINYLQDIAGRESIATEIKEEAEKKLFLLIPLVEEKIDKWLPSPLKNFFEIHKVLSFSLKWGLLLFLLWTGCSFLLSKSGLYAQFVYLKLLVVFCFVGGFLGGIIVMWIILHNFRGITNLKK